MTPGTDAVSGWLSVPLWAPSPTSAWWACCAANRMARLRSRRVVTALACQRASRSSMACPGSTNLSCRRLRARVKSAAS